MTAPTKTQIQNAIQTIEAGNAAVVQGLEGIFDASIEAVENLTAAIEAAVEETPQMLGSELWNNLNYYLSNVKSCWNVLSALRSNEIEQRSRYIPEEE